MKMINVDVNTEQTSKTVTAAKQVGSGRPILLVSALYRNSSRIKKAGGSVQEAKQAN